jgi:hypothetical protein
MGNSAIGRGSAIEENKVKASSGATADFLDGIVDNDSMLITADQLISVNNFKSNFLTRDMTLATGTQGVTGVGFQPVHVTFFACTDGGLGGCWGNDNTVDSDCVRDQSASGVDNQYGSGGNSVEIRPSAGTSYTCSITTMDADGFTLSWVRTGAPTGNLRLHFLAFR